MSTTTTIYPYISANPEIAGGVPIVSGTRVTVRRIAGYYQMGMNVDKSWVRFHIYVLLRYIRHLPIISIINRKSKRI
jgi:uncharacterized protein (DUF433 family)